MEGAGAKQIEKGFRLFAWYSSVKCGTKNTENRNIYFTPVPFYTGNKELISPGTGAVNFIRSPVTG